MAMLPLVDAPLATSGQSREAERSRRAIALPSRAVDPALPLSVTSGRCSILTAGQDMSITDLLERIEALPPAKRARAEAFVEFLSHEAPAEVTEDDPTGWEALDKIVGFIKDAPPDMAERHDFYLYGMPRK